MWLFVVSLGLGVLWAFSTEPLDAPDELAHLQVLMEVRKTYSLPESHYTPEGKLQLAQLNLMH